MNVFQSTSARDTGQPSRAEAGAQTMGPDENRPAAAPAAANPHTAGRDENRPGTPAPADAAASTNATAGTAAATSAATTPAATDSRTAGERRETVLEVRGLHKKFTRADGVTVPAVDDISFDLHAGEFMVLLGPSGCGKTTLLRAVAGLETPDTGSITVQGRTVFSSRDRVAVSPERRGLSMVFQSYALWPHMTVFDNIAYPLRSGPRPRPHRAEVAERVDRMLATMKLDGLARQYPNQLSGGQQQRVALCRALIAGSNVVLFDEPLSNVDAKVREQLRIELLLMQRELGFAALFVTHDQQEAMALAHSIAVLDRGRIVQHGTPQQVYALPATQGVAAFVGVANKLPGVVLRVDGAQVTVKTAAGELTSAPAEDTRPAAGTDPAAGRSALSAGDEVTVIWRPESCTLAPAHAPAGAGDWHGVIEESWYYGAYSESIASVGGHRFRIQIPGRNPPAKDTAVWLRIDPADVLVYPAGPVSAP